MKKLTLVLLAILSWSVLARADGLRLDRVSAEARWLVHVDFDGLKGTQFWKTIEEHAEAFDLEDTWEELDEVEREFGIDPLRDVRSMTAYGQSGEGDDAVVLFHIRGSVQQAVDRLAKEAGFRSVRRDGVDLIQWADGGDDMTAHVHRVAGSDDSLVLLGGREADVLHAARVLNREALSFEASETRRLRTLPTPGSIVFVAAEGGIPGLDGVDPASAVTELAESVYLSLGESRGVLEVHVSVTARNNEDAESMSAIFEGAAALARLGAREAFGNDPDAAVIFDILQALEVYVRGNTVALDWEYDVQRLFEDLRRLGESH